MSYVTYPIDRERKVYVAGLAWSTTTQSLRHYFEQFGEIIYANVVCDRATRRSKGFGFVTFREAYSATRACQNPNHIIDERLVSCNLAYLGARVHHNIQPNQTGQWRAIYVPYWDWYHQQWILIVNWV